MEHTMQQPGPTDREWAWLRPLLPPKPWTGRLWIVGLPGNVAQIAKYLAGKFGERLDDAMQAIVNLAAVYVPADLHRRGFRLYEQFRPGVPAGESGWGALEPDLAKVRALVPNR
jgi:hypothetical protein